MTSPRLEVVRAKPEEGEEKKEKKVDAVKDTLGDVRGSRASRRGFERMAETVALAARFHTAMEIVKRRIEMEADPKPYEDTLEKLEWYKQGFERYLEQRDRAAGELRRKGKDPSKVDVTRRPQDDYSAEVDYIRENREMDGFADGFNREVEGILSGEQQRLKEQRESITQLDEQLTTWRRYLASAEESLREDETPALGEWVKESYPKPPEWNPLEQDRLVFTAEQIVDGSAKKEIQKMIQEYEDEADVLKKHRPRFFQRVRSSLTGEYPHMHLHSEVLRKKDYLENVLQNRFRDLVEGVNAAKKRAKEAHERIDALEHEREKLQRSYDLTIELVEKMSPATSIKKDRPLA